MKAMKRINPFIIALVIYLLGILPTGVYYYKRTALLGGEKQSGCIPVSMVWPLYWIVRGLDLIIDPEPLQPNETN